ncbi:MAG: hypothetical protein M0C28_05725 [Candidatus Moduliflexus flocculans]|nr:hypothetical protein [Candidatus Moduliflexus flocculans]
MPGPARAADGACCARCGRFLDTPAEGARLRPLPRRRPRPTRSTGPAAPTAGR